MKNEYLPDYVSLPGETLLETIEAIGMTQTELARRMGRPKKTINEIIKGKAAITPETALQLELALGIPASFWHERERRYREALARLEQKNQLAEWVGWLEEIPCEELISRGLIQKSSDPIEILREVLKFFGVASPKQWETVCGEQVKVPLRKSPKLSNDRAALASWLRQGELESREIECVRYDESNFRQALHEIRGLTTKEPEIYHREMVELCRNAGVAVTITPKFPKIRVYGAARWLTPDKALIQLSLFYRSDDQFWFSFFHEAAHILLHSKKATFLDGKANLMIDFAGRSDMALDVEAEANQFAEDHLISPKELQFFVQEQALEKPALTESGRHYLEDKVLVDFANEIGIAPSIVAGRLQHNFNLDYRCGAKLKTYLVLNESGQLAAKS